MTVVVVTNDFPPRRGGIEAFVRSLCDGLDPTSVVVLTARMRGSEAVDARLPYPVVRTESRTLLPTPGVARTARAVLDRYGCDTVVFGAAAPLGLLAPDLRAAGARRVIALTHGHEVWWARVPGPRRLLRRIASGVDVLTYVSEFCRGEIAAGLGHEYDSLWWPLSPGVDVDRFGTDDALAERSRWRRRWLVPEDVPLVLAASRLVRRKGHDQLVEAWPAVVSRHPEARLVILGDGPARASLVRRVGRHAMHSSIRVVSGAPWEQMPGVYAAADAFAMPCRTRLGGLEPEAFGIVFVEAAAAGLPVVAGRSGGSSETLLDGETGYLVDPLDTDEIAAALCRLLDSPRRAAQLGRAGRAYVGTAHTADRAQQAFRRLLAG